MGLTRFNIRKSAPHIIRGLLDMETAIAGSKIEPKLRHLIKLRASQINGCAYCVEMHSREGRQEGDTLDRLAAVIVWRDTSHFSPAERAALAWTEALTDASSRADLDRIFADLEAHFDIEEIAAINACIAAINAWNRLGIGAHGTRAA
ncbi:carboxymuconolactone decarboxylase family protein [Hoeflea prorocentri]|uniref:Carboxymuconolactone decarboxylase family protein n=1 Tax=Hoeflea prorocentri TaxID=1922333 RepID=A0A9X3ZH86_9HYPH|nr:carboxymuconolactone decarboxylase family protein [Hoeflea prorocentri]MCY6380505.1 carboxymuconolactone decarboxylase family protein [Hoeflea prorocentri]MDA5398305.1 carboxymuconolactone decarboxylase family protein [Hoeflea prorocentri]